MCNTEHDINNCDCDDTMDPKKTLQKLEKLMHAHNKLLKIGCVRVGSANAANTVEDYLRTLHINALNTPLNDKEFRAFAISWIRTLRNAMDERLREIPEDEALRIIQRY